MPFSSFAGSRRRRRNRNPDGKRLENSILICDDAADRGKYFPQFTQVMVHGHGFGNPTLQEEFRNVHRAPVHIGRFAVIGANSVLRAGLYRAGCRK
ncbi:MAG: hypothetical protein WCY68_14280, partial [Desulfuromonadales bacterium]